MEIRVGENESLESASETIQTQMRTRVRPGRGPSSRALEKPSVKRKRRAEAAESASINRGAKKQHRSEPISFRFLFSRALIRRLAEK